MKHLIPIVFAICIVADVFAADAQWTYNVEAGTISDGDWTFAATASGTDLTVGAHSANPAVVSDLDFGKPVLDANNVEYTITALNPAFNNDTAGKLIGKLTLPASGLLTIGDYAFNNCTVLTNVVNYIPDSVTRVGIQSFYKCPAKQELRVYGVTHFGTNANKPDNFSKQAFAESGVTRIVFGPNLKEISDWDSGPFRNCLSLTNVTFDAAMTGGRFSGARNGGFYGCTALAGTIDLSGFSDLTYVGTTGGSGRALGNTALSKVILGSGLKKLDVNFFDQMGKLREVVFDCAPGDFAFTTSIAGGVMFGGLSADQVVVSKIREADKEAWSQYAQDGAINAISSTFSSDFAGERYPTRFLVVDGGDEPYGPLGEWVYDADAGVVSNELWSFEADGVLSMLQTVGSCVRYPDVPSILDFSASVTDKRGLPMRILALDTAFSASGTDTTPAGLKVSELRLPDSLLSISARAFARLDNCTNVVNFLPDSVTSVGNYAFYKLPVSADLKLMGIVNMGTTASDAATYQFGSSSITSVTFGPGFKLLFSWSKSPFSGCTSLTNVVFDAATTNASFGGIRTDGFYGCSALSGTVDLSGFGNLSYVSDQPSIQNIFTGTRVEKFIVSGQCTKLAAGFFDGASELKEVVFTGPPPEIKTEKYTSSGWNAGKASRLFNYNQSTRTITTYICKAHREAWAPYVEVNGESVSAVPPKGATWKPEYVTSGIDLSLRPMRLIDMDTGLVILVR